MPEDLQALWDEAAPVESTPKESEDIQSLWDEATPAAVDDNVPELVRGEFTDEQLGIGAPETEEEKPFESQVGFPKEWLNVKAPIDVDPERLAKAQSDQDTIEAMTGKAYPLADLYDQQDIINQGLEDSWGQILGKSVKSVAPSFAASVGGIVRAGEDLVAVPPELRKIIGDNPPEGYDGPFPYESKIGQMTADYYKPILEKLEIHPGDSPTKRYGGMIFKNVAQNLPIIGLGIITGGAGLSTSIMGVHAAGLKYNQLRDAGIDHKSALGMAGIVGFAEKFTEQLPTETLVKAGTPYVKKVLMVAITDVPGELIATTVESVVDKVTVRPGMTWENYVEDLGTTAIVAMGSAGILTTATHPLTLARDRQTDSQKIKVRYDIAKQKAVDEGKNEADASLDALDAVADTPDGKAQVQKLRDVQEGTTPAPQDIVEPEAKAPTLEDVVSRIQTEDLSEQEINKLMEDFSGSTELFKDIESTPVTAIKDRLVETGMSEDDAASNAALFDGFRVLAKRAGVSTEELMARYLPQISKEQAAPVVETITEAERRAVTDNPFLSEQIISEEQLGDPAKLERVKQGINDELADEAKREDLTDEDIAQMEEAKTFIDNRVQTLKERAEKGDVLEQAMPTAPTFFSQLEKVITDKVSAKASAQDVLNLIKKGNVKAEEIKWSGIEEFLKGKKKVTKEEVLDYLKANQIEVTEVDKGRSDIKDRILEADSLKSEANQAFRAAAANATDLSRIDIANIIMGDDTGASKALESLEIGNEETREAARSMWEAGSQMNAILEEERAGRDIETKFAQYTLPGGENYKELLLTLPTEAAVLEEWRVLRPDGTSDGLWASEEQAQTRADKIGGTVEGMVGKRDFETGFRSSHFDELNILAHIRFNERTDAEGNKVLFLEEVQSDWALEARKKGVTGEVPQEVKDSFDETSKEFNALRDELYGKYNISPTAVTPWPALLQKTTEKETTTLLELRTKRDKFGREVDTFLQGVPAAPFIQKNWHELALKRMLRYAAENGFDKVAWISGEQTADRYDLSKQVSNIAAGKRTDGRYSVQITGKDGNMIDDRIMDNSDMESFIGKELSKKIQENEDVDGGIVTNFSGDDLKIGGEWAFTLYDKVIPNFLKKYGKKWGAKVGESQVEVGNGKGLEAQQSIDVTQQMKDAVLGEGQSLFQREGAEPRGRIRFAPSGIDIELLKNADKSTFLHETGHLYFRMLRDLSSLETASPDLKADFESVSEWLGIKEEQDGEITVEQEEKFARGFEAYLREGKAPTSALAEAFENFKQWLAQVYQSLRDLNVELTPEVREVMGRMLAEEGVEVAEREGALPVEPIELEDEVFAQAAVAETFKPSEVTQAPMPDSIAGEKITNHLDGKGQYYETTGEGLQAYLDKHGDGFLYRIADLRGIEGVGAERVDVGDPNYLHKFKDSEVKTTALSSSLEDTKKELDNREKSGTLSNNTIVYRVLPEDIAGDFAIQLPSYKKAGQELLHAHAPVSPNISAVDVIYSSKQFREEELTGGARQAFRQRRTKARKERGADLRLREGAGQEGRRGAAKAEVFEQAPKITNIRQLAKGLGGIDFNREHLKGELNRLKENAPATKLIINKKDEGVTLDNLLEAAIERNILSEIATLDDVVNALEVNLQTPEALQEEIDKDERIRRGLEAKEFKADELKKAFVDASIKARKAYKAGKDYATVKEAQKLKRILARSRKLRIVRDYFNLTDADLKKISRKNPLLLSQYEFKLYIDDVRLKAVYLSEEKLQKAILIKTIHEKDLSRVDNYRRAMGLPPISKMTAAQAKQLTEALEPFHDGDVFLSERQLELVDRTDLDNVKTWRQARESLLDEINSKREKKITMEDLNQTKVKEWDDYKWDSALAEKDPFFKMVVTEVTRKLLEADTRIHEIENEVFALAKKSEKSRGRTLLERAIPQDQQIFDYLEAPVEDKDAIAETMTAEQLDFAHYMQSYLRNYLDYLIKVKALERGRQNYFMHVRRTFLENVKEKGLKKGIKGLFESYVEDEATFTILDEDTGNILPLEKFFQYALQRTGGLDPTTNVVKAFLAYTQVAEKKVSLDELIPKIDIYTQSITPQVYTPRGLETDRTLKQFINKYINNKKGRRIRWISKQGGKIDLAIRGLKTFTTTMDLGFNLATGVSAFVGEKAVNFQMLGPKGYATGVKRSHTKKGKDILAKYEVFVGRSAWEEFKAPGKIVSERLMEGAFALFHQATVSANKTFLLGSITEEEYNSGEISNERLAELKLEMGRFRVVPGTKSLVGSTAAGAALVQYKSWAVPALRTNLKNLETLVKNIEKKPVGERLSSKEALETYRLISLTVTALLVYGFAIGNDEDKTYSGKLLKRIYRETMTSVQALDPTLWLARPRVASFLWELSSNIKALAFWEEYKTKPGLKGVEGLQRQLTPRALKQFEEPKKKKEKLR